MLLNFKYHLVIFLTILSLSSQAKELDSLRLEKIRGKKFIVHRVEPKETLYSISKRYDVKITDIEKHNKSLTNGLKMYEEILIPTSRKKKGEQKKDIAEDTLITKDKTPSPNFHIVKAKETLFAISRFYNLSIDSLVTMNHLQTYHLSIGDTIKIKPAAMTEKLVTPENPTTETKIVQTEAESWKYHVVEPTETLFGISKKYAVSLQDLTKWNNLESYNLSVGQKIFISEKKSDKIEGAPLNEPDLKKSKVLQLDTIFVKTDNNPIHTNTTLNENGETLVSQEGFAMEIQNTDHTDLYLALHRTAEVGTVIQVKNQMNGKKISVKVVGSLPETGLNQNVMMRVSHAAFSGLGAIDAKIPVIANYTE